LLIYLPSGGVSGHLEQYIDELFKNSHQRIAPNGLKLHRKVNKFTIHIYRLYFYFIILIKTATDTQLGLPALFQNSFSQYL